MSTRFDSLDTMTKDAMFTVSDIRFRGVQWEVKFVERRVWLPVSRANVHASPYQVLQSLLFTSNRISFTPELLSRIEVLAVGF